MCTVILLRRPGADWPLIIGANRDEMGDRPWQAPGRHWPDRLEVVAGLDEVGGGSWMGVNDHGVVAALLNRSGTLGPAAGKRSRGELVLEALDHADAIDAARALGALDPDAYRAFNLVIADSANAYWLAHRGDGKIAVRSIDEGVSMLAEAEIDDMGSPRIARYLDAFESAPVPEPEQDSWTSWQTLLEDRGGVSGADPRTALNFSRDDGFGTLAHSILAIPRPGIGQKPVWRFAKAGTPAVWRKV